MTNMTHSSVVPYIGKVVTIINNNGWPYYRERVIAVKDKQVVTEYHHWLKTPEDGLLREHWIPIDNIKSITIS